MADASKTLFPSGGIWLLTAGGCGCAIAAGASSLLHGTTTDDPRALLVGAAALALLIFWTWLAQRDTVARADSIAPYSLVAAGAAAALALAVPESSFAFPGTALALGAFLLALAAAKDRAQRAPGSLREPNGYAYELLAKPLAYLLAYTAAYGTAFGLMISFHAAWLAGRPAQAGLAAGLACAGVVVAALRPFGTEAHRIDVLTRSSLVAVAAGLMFLLQPALPELAFGVFSLGAGLFFHLFVHMALDLRETFSLPAWMPAAVLTLFAATLALGLSFGQLAALANATGGNPTIPTVASVLAVIIVTVYGLDSRRVWVARDLRRDEASSEHDHAGGAWRAACSAVADKYGLTQREQEVFLLLAKGRNAAYIEKALVISNHTVKSHMLNIYKKLGIHSLQELIDLVENAKR